jgi:alpha-mannosidase
VTAPATQLDAVAAELERLAARSRIRLAVLGPFRVEAFPDPGSAASAVRHGRNAVGATLVRPGDVWGEWQGDYVLTGSFAVPRDRPAGAELALDLALGKAGDMFSHPEALVHVDGIAVAGCDRHHREIEVDLEWADGLEHELKLLAWTGIGGRFAPAPEPLGPVMGTSSLVAINRVLRRVLARARVCIQAMAAVEDARLCAVIGAGLEEALTAFDGACDDELEARAETAIAMLNAALDAAGEPLDVDVHAAGHAHLDIAWLWSLPQGRQKARRTFHTAARLLDADERACFAQSQPQLYDYVREDDPHLFETIRRQAAERRWEHLGGMWVEADCNVSGAEALVRQLLLGRAFFDEHFGADTDSLVFWVPDVFGFPATLPQLIAKSGLRHFFSIKLGGNINRFPYNSFWWEGIDGSRVLAHFNATPETYHREPDPPLGTYLSMATAEEVLGTWTNFQQQEDSSDLLLVYGYGDGGGGPTREMHENLAELDAFPGLPRVHHSRVDEFFASLEAEAGDLPVWTGELYLEYHQGTYTSEGRIKHANRTSERLLHDAELAGAWARIAVDYEYPRAELNDAWRILCRNQFHDIVCGTSIPDVHATCIREHEQIAAAATRIRAEAMRAVGASILNPSPFATAQPVLVRAVDGGEAVATQQVEEGVLVDLGELAPLSIAGTLPVVAGDRAAEALRVSERLLENDLLRIELDDNGDLVRVYDKEHGREVLAPGGVGNQLQAFPDRANEYEAWDMQPPKLAEATFNGPASVSVRERGPLRAALRIERAILDSLVIQDVRLAQGSRRLDFATTIDWRERNVLLKVAFPVDVEAAFASYDLQWGHLQRPTRPTTTFDHARFEVCAHRWADLSDDDYGVSLLNDGKYGHDIVGNVIRLSLLRSPTLPDPGADNGRHAFAYSLFPHAGQLGVPTLAAAYELNYPPIVLESGSADAGRGVGARGSLVWVDEPGVIVETVKAAEDGRGLIVRAYEALGRRATARLGYAGRLGAVWNVDLREADERELEVSEGGVELTLGPFEIITLRLIDVA